MSAVRVRHRPPTLYETGHSGSAAAGVQYAIRKAGVGAANFDFPVAHFDAANQVPHVAFAHRGVLLAQPGAGNAGKPGDVALGQQMARHLAVLLQRRDHAERLFPFAFDLRQ
ncbi:MAG: hypothetical protein WB760_14840 [Xanthobacteraceae bacterium]